MNRENICDILAYPFSKAARRRHRARKHEKKIKGIHLFMTLVVKNEEQIIEQNIRFHQAMGVDGFIVTSHNCTDKTNEILERLKKEGLVKEIFYETSKQHQLNVWVGRMANQAKRKYKANWIINADADEFYYSQHLNLKESIAEEMDGGTNVLWVYSLFLFPDNRDDFLHCPYFVTNPFTEFRAKELGILQDPLYQDFIGSQGCTKVIYKLSGKTYPQKGNHVLVRRGLIKHHSADIKLFHYHIQNYKKFLAKVSRWKEAVKFKPPGEGEHLKRMVQLEETGKLQEEYECKYGEKMRNFLIEEGVVTKDLSVSNFINHLENEVFQTKKI